MRYVSFLTALIVMAVLYLMVMERDRVMEFVGRGGDDSAAAAPDTPAEGAAPVETAAAAQPAAGAVSVVALRSVAQPVAGAVLVRGRTEAARQVDVMAETSATIVSEPLRKGAFVEAGQELCLLDPGTREISLAEAQAILSEAKSRLPEAAARLAEAQAGVPAARAALAQAQAGLPEAEAQLVSAQAQLKEAEINLNAAQRLSEDGFASETRVASAEAATESARAGVQSAKSGLEGAAAGVQSAKSGVESALAAVEAARSGQESARAGIQSAEAAVAAAQKEIDRLTISAPFEGLLETDSAELGALMMPGSLCATIIQLDPIKLVGFVPETEVDKVATGALAGGRLATGREVQGQVTFLSRAADPTTRTFRVEIEIANPELTIRDGQTAEIMISSGDEVAHLLPQSSLTLDNAGRIGVRLVTGDLTAAFAPVHVLRDTASGIWVAGLPETADVIVVGQEFVTDGVAIAPTFRQEHTQ